MAANELTSAIRSYQTFLAEAVAQHERTLADANRQLQELIAQTEPSVLPQSAWIVGADGERFLMLNESAAAHINDVIEKMGAVVAELTKQTAKPK